MIDYVHSVPQNTLNTNVSPHCKTNYSTSSPLWFLSADFRRNNFHYRTCNFTEFYKKIINKKEICNCRLLVILLKSSPISQAAIYFTSNIFFRCEIAAWIDRRKSVCCLLHDSNSHLALLPQCSYVFHVVIFRNSGSACSAVIMQLFPAAIWATLASH